MDAAKPAGACVREDTKNFGGDKRFQNITCSCVDRIRGFQ